MADFKNLDYWYDQQIRRYLLQLIRLFSGFHGAEYTENGQRLNRVPCRYGDPSRMVSHLLRNNSENFINNAPQMTIAIQSLQPAKERIQDPFLEDTQQVAEREWDEGNRQYTSRQGNLYTVKRYMPVPYNLTFQLDIWTTNTDTKLQLIEQLFVLFNPSIQLQSNDNPLDWSNVMEVEMTDFQWSSRSLPQGVDEQLDVATLTFTVPIWINPPAKVQRQKIIQQIVNNIHNTNIQELRFDAGYYDFFDIVDEDATVVVSPNDLRVDISSGKAQLLTTMNQPYEWNTLFEMLGTMGSRSRLELNTGDDVTERDQLIVGAISEDPTDPSMLNFILDTDTLPTNTVANIDKIIDPRASVPGVDLPAAMVGQRYMIIEDIDESSTWGVTATENDILEYNGTDWVVAFNSSVFEGLAFVTNDWTNQQYKWDGSSWISSWQGTYREGWWRAILA